MNSLELSTINNYQLIIFDLDGTLYDKRSLSLRVMLHALSESARKTKAKFHKITY